MPASCPERPRSSVGSRILIRVPVDAGVLAVLARQDGLITSEQAARYGLGGCALRRRVRDGGWERDLLRFTWHDLTHRPDYVVGKVRAALMTATGAA